MEVSSRCVIWGNSLLNEWKNQGNGKRFHYTCHEVYRLNGGVTPLILRLGTE